MSRVGIYPLESQVEKSITIQSTNPKFDKKKLIDHFIGTWNKIDELVKSKICCFFSIKSMEAKKKPEAGLKLNFRVLKDSSFQYSSIIDAIQEFLPEHGIRIVEHSKDADVVYDSKKIPDEKLIH